MSIDVDKCIAQLCDCQLISEAEVEALCTAVIRILRREPNIVSVSAPVSIVGDLHGQFYDLLELFATAGTVPHKDFVFLGDFVDRGPRSAETFLLLMALKLRHPSHVTLIRGNHESRQITQVYGFYDECLRKFGSTSVWRHCTEVFDCLPLACVISQTALCVHGGLSPLIAPAPTGDTAAVLSPPASLSRRASGASGNVPGSVGGGGSGFGGGLLPMDSGGGAAVAWRRELAQVEGLDRFVEVPRVGLFADLLWSDPDGDGKGWAASVRGAGHVFGGDVVAAFLRSSGLSTIYRAHQLVMEGYKSMFGARLYTVWSAPNYCNRCGNVAAVADIDDECVPMMLPFEGSPRGRHEGGSGGGAGTPAGKGSCGRPDYFL